VAPHAFAIVYFAVLVIKLLRSGDPPRDDRYERMRRQ
jgi:hypothetical protein